MQRYRQQRSIRQQRVCTLFFSVDTTSYAVLVQSCEHSPAQDTTPSRGHTTHTHTALERPNCQPYILSACTTTTTTTTTPYAPPLRQAVALGLGSACCGASCEHATAGCGMPGAAARARTRRRRRRRRPRTHATHARIPHPHRGRRIRSTSVVWGEEEEGLGVLWAGVWAARRSGW